MMPTMKTRKPTETSSNIWTDEEIKLQFKGFVAGLRMPPELKRRHKVPYLEEVTEALWLWFSRKSKPDAQAFLSEHLHEAIAFKARTETPPVDPGHTVKERRAAAKKNG